MRTNIYGDPFAASPLAWKQLLILVLKEVGRPVTIDLGDIQKEQGIITEPLDSPCTKLSLTYYNGTEEHAAKSVRHLIRARADERNAIVTAQIMIDSPEGTVRLIDGVGDGGE